MDLKTSSREFLNPFPDYSLDADNVTAAVWRKTILSNTHKLLAHEEDNLSVAVDWSDTSVYTGTSGIALMYLHLSNVLGPERSQEYLAKALPYVEKQLGGLKGRQLSFLCGDPGPIAISAVLYHKMGRQAESLNLVKRLEKFQSSVTDLHSDLPDELLYGRVGYLYSLMFVKKHIPETHIDKELMKNVVHAVLKSGEHLSRKEKHSSPLMYKWHDSYYLGAAHGVSGIMYMILQAKDYLTQSELTTLVKPTIDYLMTLQYPSGNYPSSLGSNNDKLVHWCHGAPGFIHMFVMAFQVFRSDKYLNAAQGCADAIWKRGLLRRGYGICHGPSGNAYGFLALYRVTQDPKYLYRARKFADWCFDYGKHGCRTPDRPFSLFEGYAGTIYFLADLLDPEHAAFPAFQLW